MAQEIDSVKLSEDRKNYYDKWDKFTKDEVQKSKQQDEEEKAKADKELGLDSLNPKSQAEKEDMDKREALKEAKKQWEDRELSEAAKKFAIENWEGKEKVLDSVKLKWKPVITFKNNKNCKLKIPHNLKHRLIKVFVESCENCEFDFEAGTITQHIEISHSKNCTFRFKAATATVQLDLCEDMNLSFASDIFVPSKLKVFHAGVKNLHIETHEGDKHRHCYLDDISEEDEFHHEIQFITQKIGDEIVTERVVRDAGNLPATAAELKEKEISARNLIRQAELKKIGGNEAFKEKNYAQAAVFYTEAIDVLGTAKKRDEFKEDQDDFTHVLLANRAFCWQKLGHNDKAEEDCRQCVALRPDYVKGHFRLGLSLHAQKKYFEAAPILGKALELEPKNEQIKQALGFAELQMRKMMQHDD